MTIIFDRTKEKTEEKKKKPIEFVWIIIDGNSMEANYAPNNYGVVERIATSYETGNYDIILAWDEGVRNKMLFLGHWNDGVVE